MLVDYITKKRPNGYWTEARAREESKKYPSIREFEKGCSRGYALCRELGIVRELFKSKLTSHNKEEVIEEAKNFTKVTEFKDSYPRMYDHAARHGYLKELPFDITRWTVETVTEEAKKYPNKMAFQKGSCGAYEAAIRFGIIDKLQPRSTIKWTRELVVAAAFGINSRSDFYFNNPNAYSAARRLGLMGELFPEHGGYPTRDHVYVYHCRGDIYKIGITTGHRKENRIHKVKSKAGFKSVSILVLTRVKAAQKLEVQLLKNGSPVLFEGKFDGYSEFRHLTETELNKILAIVEANKL